MQYRELLDDMRERIVQHYDLALHNLLREQYGQTHPADDHDIPVDGPPF